MEMLSIGGRVAAAASRAGGNRRIERAVIGLGLTMVCLEGGACGLAYTLRDELEKGCDAFDRAGSLKGMGLQELLTWIGGDSPLASSVGLAAANAMLSPAAHCLEHELFETLNLKPGERVTTVGYFKPLDPVLRMFGVDLQVIERGDSPEPLRRCDVALITATSIINHTLDELLTIPGKAREIVILGPSTPFAPDAFSSTGVTLLAGSVVRDAARAWDVVCQGGGMMGMGDALHKWVTRV